MSNKVFTPENISKLKQNEVFVFGSNKAGNHVGGAARVAVEKFGAIMGHGEGLQGQSYAIPTLDEQMDKVSTEELTRSVRRFADYTRYNTDKVFYVTKIGCGIAGFSVEEIVEVFKSVSFGDNVVLPQEFGEEKHIDGFKGFNADMTCLGFKFEEGKTYEEDVELKVCNRGFHFCESPFSVLSYRDMLDDECKFIPVHHVTALGRCHSDSDKTATTKIHIGAKLDFKGFIKAGIDFIYEKCIKEGPTDNVNSGDDATDRLLGLRRTDRLLGRPRKDRLLGRPRKDRLLGRPRKDRLLGRPRKDRLLGLRRKDRLLGLRRKDRLLGLRRKDRLLGRPRKDRLLGRPRKDRLLGLPRTDRLLGRRRTDRLLGRPRTDRLLGLPRTDSAPRATSQRSAPRATSHRSAPRATSQRSAPRATAQRSAPRATAQRSAPRATAHRSAPRATAQRSAPRATAHRSAPRATARRSKAKVTMLL